MQWPIGALSDRYDRRLILTIVTFLTAASAFACAWLSSGSTSVILLSVGIFGGLAFPLYSVCIAYTNDHLQPNQMIAASGSLVLIGGLGSVLGPILVAGLMDLFEDNAFFWAMGVAHLLTGLFGLYRMTKRPAMPLDQQGELTPTTIHPSSWVIESAQHQASDEELQGDAEKVPESDDP